MSTELAASRRSVESARADNVVLYEKLRYLESYSQRAAAQFSQQGSGANSGSGGKGQHHVPKVVRVDEAGLLADTTARDKANRCGWMLHGTYHVCSFVFSGLLLQVIKGQGGVTIFCLFQIGLLSSSRIR